MRPSALFRAAQAVAPIKSASRTVAQRARGVATLPAALGAPPAGAAHRGLRRVPRRLLSSDSKLPVFDDPNPGPSAAPPDANAEPEQPAATEENLKHLNEHVTTCYAAGMYRDALEAALMAAGVAKALFGDAHPAVGSALNNLALIHKSLGEYDEAARLFSEALKVYSAVHGNEHASTLTCMLNFAAVLRAVGDLDRALPVYKKVVEGRGAASGERSVEYAVALSHLAGLHRDRGEAGEAERAYGLALDAARGAPPPAGGERSAVAGAILNNLALLLKAREPARSAPALFCLLRLWAGRQTQGETARAEELYKQALEIRREVLGPEHPLYAETVHNLVELYKMTGQDDLSVPLRKELARFTPVDVDRSRPARRAL
eukprot:tig00021127_g18837.t1